MSDDDATRPHLRLVGNDVAPDPGGNGRQPPPEAAETGERYVPGSFAHLFDLTGRVALIVGGGGGIGSAIAAGLADFGARVAVADLDLDAAKRAAQACARPGHDGALAVQLDVTNGELIQQVVQAVEQAAGRIDILVNSAGINLRKPAIDYSPDDWRRILDVNLSGAFFVIQAVARGMLARRSGRIVSIGSVSSLLGHPCHAPYAAAKGGLAIMTKALATEWAAHGVTVNAIGPAYTETALTRGHLADVETRTRIVGTIPMGRLGTPEDVVGAAVYLCSDAAAFVTGQTLYVDGGRTCD